MFKLARLLVDIPSLGARSLGEETSPGSHRLPRTRSWACPQNTELGKQICALDKRRATAQGRSSMLNVKSTYFCFIKNFISLFVTYITNLYHISWVSISLHQLMPLWIVRQLFPYRIDSFYTPISY